MRKRETVSSRRRNGAPSTPRVKRSQRRRKLGYVPLPQGTWVPREAIEAVCENWKVPEGRRDDAAVRAAIELDFARLVNKDPPPE
jgi:hypothetical protein